MSDRYQGFVSSPIGKLLVKNLGLPSPTRLERYAARRPARRRHGRPRGRRPPERVAADRPRGASASRGASRPPARSTRRLVFDATGITGTEGLIALQEFFTPLMRSLETCPRIVVLGTTPESVSGSERIAQRALEGFTRSLGKEVGKGGTVQLVYVTDGADAATASTLAFLLSPKSAYVSGQVVRIGAHQEREAEPVADWARPLEGRIALVTGASRGIGEQIARVLHRDGATVVGVDVPQAASELQALMRELDGDYLTLDITGKDAPQRIAHHLATEHGGVDIVVHNAGITRDKMLANMAEDRWDQCHRRQPHRARAHHAAAAATTRWSTTTAASSASPRSPASPATSARPTTPRPRPASSASSTRSPTTSGAASPSTPWRRASSSPP